MDDEEWEPPHYLGVGSAQFIDGRPVRKKRGKVALGFLTFPEKSAKVERVKPKPVRKPQRRK